MKRTRGFTLIELLVVIAIIALLIGLLLPALATAQRNARSMKDGSQQKQIHTAFLTYSQTTKGQLPVPGLIDRLPVTFGFGPGNPSQNQPGIGAEDYLQNFSGPVYSAMVAQEYFGTDVLIGPTEVNPIVKRYELYNYAKYNPAGDTYWDDNFKVFINTPPQVPNLFCHTSFAHTAICGDRKNLRWRDTQDSAYPIVGTRGTKQGVGPGSPEYNKSPTLQLHGSKRQWDGNLVFADNHWEQSITFYPAQTTYEPTNGTGGPLKDNIFNYEFEGDHVEGPKAASDAWLAISMAGGQYVAIEGNDAIP